MRRQEIEAIEGERMAYLFALVIVAVLGLSSAFDWGGSLFAYLFAIR